MFCRKSFWQFFWQAKIRGEGAISLVACFRLCFDTTECSSSAVHSLLLLLMKSVFRMHGRQTQAARDQLQSPPSWQFYRRLITFSSSHATMLIRQTSGTFTSS